MKPMKFSQMNKIFGPPIDNKEYKHGVDPLPAWTDGGQHVSCWRMSFRERLSALVFGRAWIVVIGSRHPPIYSQISNKYFLENPKDDQRQTPQ